MRIATPSIHPLPPLLTHNQLRHAERQASHRAGQSRSLPIILLVVFGVAYNGILAYLNARGLYIGREVVVATEFLLLSGVFLTLLASRSKRIDGIPALFFGFFLLSALLVSLFGGTIFVEMARNAAIIALFLMLGTQVSASALAKCFLIAAAITFAVLLIEIFSVETYARLFSPASYFAQTRGFAPSEFDQLGLFGNALGWDERFSILRIIDHRAASIFLEQVSLANFAVVLAIFLCCRWRAVAPLYRFLLIPVIALLVITTASRAALAMVLLAPLAYWLAPRLNRFVSLAVMPIVLVVALVVTKTRPPSSDDNLVGRLGYTIKNLENLDLSAIAGLKALEAPIFADSGYMYVIVASSILGLLFLWLFAGLIAAGRSDNLKRCSLLLNLYVFSNLSVSGTSIFSIKTAALLWLLVGFMRQSEKESAPALAKQTVPAPTPMPPRARFA